MHHLNRLVLGGTLLACMVCGNAQVLPYLGPGPSPGVTLSNSDGTIVLAPNPTVGAGTVSLNLANVNTWTAVQTFSAGENTTFVNVTGSTIPTNGFYLSAANTIGIATNSTLRATISLTGIASNTSGGGRLNWGVSTSTAPTLIPNTAAVTTGFGGDGTNLYGIIGGVTAVTWTSTGEAITTSGPSALAVGLTGVTNPAFQVDASTALQVAGLKVTGAATGGTVAISAIDSGSNTNLNINAKGTGTIGIGSISTGSVTITPNLAALGTSNFANNSVTLKSSGDFVANTADFGWSSTSSSAGSIDTFLTRAAAGVIQCGPADAATAAACTFQAQSVSAGNANTAGAAFTIGGSKSNGSGCGDLVFQTTLGTAASGTQNSLATAMTLKGCTQSVVFAAGIFFSGTIPTVTGTGSPTIATGSTDTAGEVTSGSAATSVVVTFVTPKTNAPVCSVTAQTQLVAFAYTISTTAITITQTATTGEKIDYVCFQH